MLVVIRLGLISNGVLVTLWATWACMNLGCIMSILILRGCRVLRSLWLTVLTLVPVELQVKPVGCGWLVVMSDMTIKLLRFRCVRW